MNALIYGLIYVLISAIVIISKSILDKKNGVDNYERALTIGAFWPAALVLFVLMVPGLLFRRLYKIFNK